MVGFFTLTGLNDQSKRKDGCPEHEFVVYKSMKERTKNMVLGNWLYTIYRRTRYIRYLKRVRNVRKKQLKRENDHKNLQFKGNITRQRELERNREKRKKQAEKDELNQLKQEAQRIIISKAREEKELERLKTRKLKAEQKTERQEVKSRLRDKARQDRSLLLQQKRTKIQEKQERNKRIRQLRPYLIKRRIREIFRALKSIDKETFQRWFRWLIQIIENKTERNQFVKITLNSIALFVLSYLTLYIVGELITVYAAESFDYQTILFYYKVYYNIDSDQWNADAVKILFSIKPLAGLVFGTIAMIIYSSLKNDNQVFKLYFLWLFVHGMVMFFGSLLMGTLLNQGFGWVIAYLYYKDTGKMVFSIISIFALVVTGTSIARSFLTSGNAYFNFISRDNRKFLLISQMLFPVIIGTAIISMLKVPVEFYYTTSEEVAYEIFKLCSIFIVVIPIILTFSSFSTIFFDENTRAVKFHWPFIVLSLIVFFGYRYLTMNGIEFVG